MEIGIIKHEKVRFQKNALVIDDTITIDEWKDLGQSLRQIEGCVFLKLKIEK